MSVKQLLLGATHSSGGYVIDNSVYSDGTTGYFTKTFGGAATSDKILTLSWWIKRVGTDAGNYHVIASSGSDSLSLIFNPTDQVRLRWNNTITTAFLTSASYRDFSAFNHFVLTIDTTQVTDTNRLKLYVNGTLATLTSTSYPAQNATTTFGSAIAHSIYQAGGLAYYLANVIYVDGQALDSSSFGETDANGNWVPKDLTGLTFGTNGFWLKFENGADLGEDSSGLANTEQWFRQTDGTASSDLSSISIVIDGNKSQAAASCATKASTTSFYYQKQWSAVRSVDGFRIVGPNNGAGLLWSSPGGLTITITLEGSNNGTDWTTLHTDTVLDDSIPAATTGYLVTSGVTGGSYLYHRVAASWSGSLTTYISEIEFRGTYANHYTVNGTITQTTDSPTDDAANDVGNYCTLNAVDKDSNYTLASGNLDYTAAGTGTHINMRGTIFLEIPFYFEFEGVTSAKAVVGVANGTIGLAQTPSTSPGYDNCWAFYTADGSKVGGGVTWTAYGSAVSVGTRMAVAVDPVNQKIWVGTISAGTITWFASGDPVAGTNPMFSNVGTRVAPFINNAGTGTGHGGKLFFGATGFAASSVPTGFKPLSTANLPAPAIADPSEHFQTVLDTGANIKTAAEAVFSSNDYLVWIKDRQNANNHQIFDTVRGTSAILQSNSTGAETTYSAPSGNSVAHVWKAGTGGGASNTDGSITSTVSVNTAAGFSIVKFTKGSGDETVGHGLGATPKLIITKSRTNSGNSWAVWHAAVCTTVKDMMRLQLSNGLYTDASNLWGIAVPNSTVFGVSNAAFTGDMVAYCWAEVPGFSKFGSYAGVSGGPFLECGFTPAWALFKNTSGAYYWQMTNRESNGGFNGTTYSIYPNATDGESNEEGSNAIDFLANALKPRGTGHQTNFAAENFIFAAFAHRPFGGEGVSQARAQ